jgi:phosphatidylinositol N-acetylglucosaminyltransferase subunit A
MLNRLVYRKGIDLQAVVIPALCRAHADVRFLFGGDGPRRGALEEMVAAHGLERRVRLVGAVQHEHARALLVQGAPCTQVLPLAFLLCAAAGVPDLCALAAICASVAYWCRQQTRAPGGTGDIFLNTSLTEAFCMAIVEAASCGLLVVSTNVGGVPEVLPARMRLLADPTPASLLTAVNKAIARVRAAPIDRQQQHDEVRWPAS